MSITCWLISLHLGLYYLHSKNSNFIIIFGRLALLINKTLEFEENCNPSGMSSCFFDPILQERIKV